MVINLLTTIMQVVSRLCTTIDNYNHIFIEIMIIEIAPLRKIACSKQSYNQLLGHTLSREVTQSHVTSHTLTWRHTLSLKTKLQLTIKVGCGVEFNICSVISRTGGSAGKGHWNTSDCVHVGWSCGYLWNMQLVTMVTYRAHCAAGYHVHLLSDILLRDFQS